MPLTEGYDPEVHKIDLKKWEHDKNARGARVTIDRWTKNGEKRVSVAYWAYKGSRPKDEYRVHVVASTLEEAIYKAERLELATVMNALFPHQT